MDDKQTEEKNGKLALGISFMTLGVSLGVTFGVTMGWQFAPIGLAFIVLGIVFLTRSDEAAQDKEPEA